MEAANTPHPVDVHVGRQLRAARKAAGISQQALGDALGITFQQVQKYERGTNRISSSKLYDAACILGRPIGDFYAGLSAPERGPAKPPIVGDLAFQKAIDAIPELQHVGDLRPDVRKSLRSIIKAMVSASGLNQATAA